jgi:2-succinyl-6-hydroxy-2,4-cyclohexadiene-1-carboxylate synthase
MQSYPAGASPARPGLAEATLRASELLDVPLGIRQGSKTLPLRTTGAAGVGSEPIVLLHGFTQTAASWGPISKALAQHGLVLAPDLPGHGEASAVSADLWQTADLLAATLSAAGVKRANWVGYSLGGRAALHLALAHPGLVKRLVLVSTSAGIEDDHERELRRRRDEALAKRIEEGGDQALRDFLAEWLSQPLFATLPPERAGLDERLANSASGLASSLRLAGAGSQGPLWHRLGELGTSSVPVLLVTGELDSTYRRHAERMAQAFGPSASIKVIAGAGHACHLEQPELFVSLVGAFCAGVASQRRRRPS